ncbi:GTP cyclohydrolase IIa [Halobacteriales archaeon SW_7_68_16]|nr:MAG: GTP cyclohydrolase IIa [Halobacteriales archaeon SW_7_68_16]
MVVVQVTLFQIDNYGPWTVTPEPYPESDLQALQADLYADLSRAVGTHDGTAFPTRFDNVVAVTDGMDRLDHDRLVETIANRYPVTVSAGVGADPRPADALVAATAALQGAGSAQDGDRQRVLRGEPGDAGTVRIAHFDVVAATDRYTDAVSAYDSLLSVRAAGDRLMRLLYDRHDALTFFVGGDNLIAVVPDLPDRAYERAVDRVADATGVDLKVGVGAGATGREAGLEAKHALERCRERATTVERAAPVADADD